MCPYSLLCASEVSPTLTQHPSPCSPPWGHEAPCPVSPTCLPSSPAIFVSTGSCFPFDHDSLYMFILFISGHTLLSPLPSACYSAFLLDRSSLPTMLQQNRLKWTVTPLRVSLLKMQLHNTARAMLAGWFSSIGAQISRDDVHQTPPRCGCSLWPVNISSKGNVTSHTGGLCLWFSG